MKHEIYLSACKNAWKAPQDLITRALAQAAFREQSSIDLVSLICLDENEFLIDLVVRGITQKYEMAGHSHSTSLWRCLLVASRQE